MEKYDLVIVGGGPGGLTAAIYASRANLSVAFIEKGAPGGKMVKTFKIENWTGDREIGGAQLSMRMFEHAKAFGAKYKYGNVTKIDTEGENRQFVTLESGEKIEAKAVIIATGMIERVPEEVKGIREYENRGVSYCAICDGPLFRDKPIAFIGGGNSAAEEALFASAFASKVYIFVRKDHMRAEHTAVENLSKKTNVQILYKSTILEIQGKNSIESVKANIDGKEQTLQVNAVFPYVGQEPVSTFIKHLNITDENGFIETDSHMMTRLPGIYAVGDIRVKDIRQIATAVSDGAIAGKIITSRI